MTRLLDDLLAGLPEGRVEQVLIGLHWTAVVVDVAGDRRCGLASTLCGPTHHGNADVPAAGQLQEQPARALAALAHADGPILAAVGVAALNALLPPLPATMEEENATDVIAAEGAGREVALIGHFPFVPQLVERVGSLWVLEQTPQPGDLPATAAAEVLPQAAVVAITGTTLINHTLEELLALCAPDARVILLGPSAPLSSRLFAHGIDIVCGSMVTAVDPVLRVVAQGGTFRQVHRAGVRTVTLRA